MNMYRTHHCSALSMNNLNEEVKLSGWIDTKRDHGKLLFIDFVNALYYVVIYDLCILFIYFLHMFD